MKLRFWFLVFLPATLLLYCEQKEESAFGLVVDTNVTALFGPNYDKTVVYQFIYNDSTYLDSSNKVDDLPYIGIGDTLILGLRINNKNQVTMSEVIGKKNITSSNSLTSIKLKGGKSKGDTLLINNSGKIDSLIAIGDQAKLLKKENFNDVYLYDLLTIQPYMVGYQNKIIDFFVENSIFTEVENDESERLYFRFVVTKNGDIKNLDILTTGIPELVIQEVEKKIKEMPEWKPGFKDDEPVNTILFLTLYY